jgi:hypothetical protein
MSEHDMRVDIGGGREQIRRVDYPANSKLSREKNKAELKDREPLQKIVSSPVDHRKRGMFSEVLKTFLVEDSESIVRYLVMDVLVPAAKNTISEVVTQALQQAFWGGRGQAVSGSRPGYTSYTRTSTTGRTVGAEPARTLSRQARSSHDVSNVIIKTRGEAEDVIDMLRTMIDQYQMASVNDLYDLLGLTSDFTDAKWGWTDLRGASVRPVHGGYVLDLPNTIALT